jgi:hypothetical protein
MTSRTALLPTVSTYAAAAARGREKEFQAAKQKAGHQVADVRGTFEEQLDKMSIITGTPDTVIPKVRHVLEYLRPGNIFFWDGDGAMTHDDAMRSLRLMGEEVIPAVRDMAKELDLKGAFDVDPATNQPIMTPVA